MTRAPVVVALAVLAVPAPAVVGVSGSVPVVLVTAVAAAAAGIQRTPRPGAVSMLPLATLGRALPLLVAGGMRWPQRGTVGQRVAAWTCPFLLSRPRVRAAAY